MIVKPTLWHVGLICAVLLSPLTVRADALSEAAGKYQIMPQSRIGFDVAQAGGGGITGTFGKFSGTFILDASGLEKSRVELQLFPESVKTGQKRVEDFLRSSAVFDTEKFAQVTFRSSKITQLSPTTARVEGVLNARGISKPAKFDVSLEERKGASIVFHVTGKVLRSPFGMDVGTPIYSNVVQFDMMLAGKRQ
jgi:polyisoprenoid-binding protein YceI